jgi:hypothetical protein
MNQPDKNDKLWKTDQLNDTYAKFYSPSDHLAVNEVIVLFKWRVIFKQYIPNKHKHFSTKIYKPCDITGCTYKMRIYLAKGRQNATQAVTAIHATVISLTRRIEVVGHELYMDNFSSSPDSFDDLHTRDIKFCGTVIQNHEGLARGL